jgi:hypothetical protein
VSLWNWLSRYFPRGFRRSSTAHLELAGAYQRVFTGHGTERDAQFVLTDLANYTGFYRVSGPGLSAEDRAFADGQRAAFGRLFRFLRMSADETRLLEEAARAEALADSEEGNF